MVGFTVLYIVHMNSVVIIPRLFISLCLCVRLCCLHRGNICRSHNPLEIFEIESETESFFKLGSLKLAILQVGIATGCITCTHQFTYTKSNNKLQYLHMYVRHVHIFQDTGKLQGKLNEVRQCCMQ